MRLVLDPRENACHGAWLRKTPGAYEWWYFDALSDTREWALTCIWFLGNPFSPYYRLAAKERRADPFEHNGLFFALYRHGALYAYHFSRFPQTRVDADEARPATLRFGPNALDSDEGCHRLHLADENANCRTLEAHLTFAGPPLVGEAAAEKENGERHFWLPTLPVCRVSGEIVLRERQNRGAERIAFTGSGYHDHNWGALPFDKDVRDWYWARAALSPTRALILYHVRSKARAGESRLLLFDGGRLVHRDDKARVELGGWGLNAFGTRYARRLTVQSGDLRAVWALGARLDSAPFYLRTLCEVRLNGSEAGQGIGEYFRPRMLGWALTASATKARIVEQ